MPQFKFMRFLQRSETTALARVTVSLLECVQLDVQPKGNVCCDTCYDRLLSMPSCRVYGANTNCEGAEIARLQLLTRAHGTSFPLPVS